MNARQLAFLEKTTCPKARQYMIEVAERSAQQPEYFFAVIVDATSPSNGQIIASTKGPHSQYKGMSKEQFTEATRYISCYKIEIQ